MIAALAALAYALIAFGVAYGIGRWGDQPSRDAGPFLAMSWPLALPVMLAWAGLQKAVNKGSWRRFK